MMTRILFLAAAFVAQPLVNEDVLEPSVENEVAHALARIPTNLLAGADSPRGAGDARASLPVSARDLSLLATNGLSRTALAIRLVSLQRADGRFYVGTNDVTAAAVRMFKEL